MIRKPNTGSYNTPSSNQKHPFRIWVVAALVSIAAYICLAYFTHRSQTGRLLALFTTLFAAYGLLYRSLPQNAGTNKLLRYAIGLAILYRAIVWGAFPNLSDDVYRFVWDGRLCAAGISPYAHLPSDFFNGKLGAALPSGINAGLYGLLNSPDYYSIYPPVCQYVCWLGATLFPDSVTGTAYVMKTALFAFECGSIFLLCNLLEGLQLPPKRALLYALNPLAIVELVGNIHFEAAMIFFLLLGILCWLNYSQPARFGNAAAKSGWLAATAVCLGLAVCSKLLPLIFLPFFTKRLGIAKAALFCALAGLTVIVCFAPFADPGLLPNIWASIRLYYQSFEFNASFYYLARQLGYWTKGYNTIAVSGKIMAACSLAGILFLAWREKSTANRSLFLSLLLALTVHFAFANIVHPWYICGLLALCPFTPMRFPVVWSAAAVLTYQTYRTAPYSENLWLVAFEYALVYGYLHWELRNRNLLA